MNMWFVNVIRIVPQEQRKHYFSRWSAFRSSIKRALHRKKFNLFADYKDYRGTMSPAIDVRTWGFYTTKEMAVACVKENRTDIHENYYPWAVIESVNEGVIAETEEQIFFEWDQSTQAYKEIGAIPQEIENSDKNCYMRQFTTLG